MVILYKNDSIIVCIKPAGISSQGGTDDSMTDLLSDFCGGKSIFPVHRLDMPVSGVMVYAKTKEAAAFLSKEIAENRFSKEYTAIVHGIPPEKSGRLEDFLFRDSKKNKSFVVKRARKGVKKAILEYETDETKITECGPLTKVSIKLITGRTHQIRVQFASRKMPLFGDGKYGASDSLPYIALFCRKLTFRDPESGSNMTFSSELPEWNFFK